MKLPLGPGVRLLTSHPAGLVALEKPAGVRSHPNTSGQADGGALLATAYDAKSECYAPAAGGAPWWLLNRLDGPTSGVILLASQEDLAREVKRLFAGREVEKVYLAIVRGRPRKSTELWRDRLRTGRRGGELRTEVHPGGDPSEAEARCQRSVPWGADTLSQIELRPHTGRTHQLRVQCASRYLPIVGDATYGDFAFNRRLGAQGLEKRLYLHAAETRLEFVWQGAPVKLIARSPAPESFKRLLGSAP